MPFELELNSTNLIKDSERHGKAHDLFWPWFGANVSVLAISYGAFVLGFNVSFWQGVFAAVFGTVFSFLLVGISSLAGKKSNAPTMIVSRAAFGVKGNLVPGLLSYLVFVGWETVLVSLSTLATATVFDRLGSLGRGPSLSLGFAVSVALTVMGGVFGFKVIMQMQKWISLFTMVATAIYIVLTLKDINWHTVMSLKHGTFAAMIGALILLMTGLGLGWVNSAADYARYLPHNIKSNAVVGWTVFGASLAPVILVIYGIALAGSSKKLSDAVANDPIGALTNILPTWFLFIFAILAILGLIGGSILDLYSSGLTLIAIGLDIKRHYAAMIDAVIMVLGTIYIVWFSKNFLIPFEGFLVTIGVPLAAWSAIFVADVLERKKGYDEASLFDPNGKYGSVNWKMIILLVVASIIGFGFVTNTYASWLSWQGYFMGAIGGKSGQWAYANLGVLFALIIGFVGRKLIRLND